jgi:hypothetical protein
MENVYVDIRNECDFIRDMFENKDIVSIEEIFTKLEDLVDEKTDLEIKFEDFKRDVEDNYRPVSYKEQLGED